MAALLLPEHLTILMQLGFRLKMFWVSDMIMNVVYSSFEKNPPALKQNLHGAGLWQWNQTQLRL